LAGSITVMPSKMGYTFTPSSPAIGPDGTIYVGSNDNYLYAIIYGNNDGLSNTSWPMFHHDIRHQGISKKRNPIGTVNVRYLHVGNGPGVDFEIVTTLSKKTVVVILKKEKGWYVNDNPKVDHPE